MIKSEQFPYCGVAIVWSNAPHRSINFSDYKKVRLSLDYEGEATKIRVFARNDYPSNELAANPIEGAKFLTTTIKTSDLNQVAEIHLSELSVADWWLDNFNIPRERSGPEFDKVLAFGIDQANPVVYGDHTFILNKIELIGLWVSKEVLYIGIIALWLALFLFEMLTRFFSIRKKAKLDAIALKKLAQKSKLYKQRSETDKLTGISNREGLAKTLSELEKSNSLNKYAILVLDIDHFKHVNDQHGHAVGDEILEEVAQLVNTNMRNEDIVARWGGEEFIILIRCEGIDTIKLIADKIRENIALHSFSDNHQIHITVSIGAAPLHQDEGFHHAFVLADKALYEAKRNGRDQVIISK